MASEAPSGLDFGGRGSDRRRAGSLFLGLRFTWKRASISCLPRVFHENVLLWGSPSGNI